jgi:ribosomal protein L11 methylase PrmA
MSKHLYFYLEDLALTVAQRNTLINTVREYGEENASQFPHRRMQTRARADNKAMIFEAVFKDDQLTAAHFQQVLANIFGVPAANITYVVSSPSYGQLVTYSYNSTARLRL